jgi:chemotaxis protein methyltransferase CheR
MQVAEGALTRAQDGLLESDFRSLSELIKNEVGINLPLSKKTMLESRLRKRLIALGLNSFRDYCDLLFGPDGMLREGRSLVDAVTTNKTDFFREPAHFDFLSSVALPDLRKRRGHGGPLRVWSAACSTGEEPYTLAMVLSEFFCAGQGFEVIATDVSSRVLEVARRAIYDEDRIAPVPAGLRKRYFLRSVRPGAGVVRVSAEIRGLVRFLSLNLMEGRYPFDGPMDVIFLRNIMIYFDRETQEALLKNLMRYLSLGGYLFIGHSETLNGMPLPLLRLEPSIYRRIG